MFFSKKDTRKGVDCSHDPLLAAASLIDFFNISDIARHMGKSPKTMLAKLNNDSDFHQLNLGEAIAITNITGDKRILNSWANSLGFILVEEPSVTGVTDDEFSDLLLTLQSELGQLSKVILGARSDGIITSEEYIEIHSKTVNSIQIIYQLDEVLKSQIRGGL